MSAIASRSTPWQPGALRQAVSGDGKTRFVAGWLGKGAQTFQQPQGLQHSGIDADAHRVVASLNPLQCRTACESPFGNNCRRQSAPAAGVADISTKLAERSPYRYRRPVWGGHSVIFLLR
jgi:hypothetical protein